MGYLKALVTIFLVFSTNAHAAGSYVVTDATITNVANTSSAGQNFAVLTRGGSGACDGQWIRFPEANAANPNAHQRAFSVALTALSSGMKVDIYNYVDGTCALASYIELKK